MIPMKVLIADDHWVVRESLKQVLRRLDKVHQAYEASNFEEAIEILRKNSDLDLMLADLIMPGFDEFHGLKRLRAEFPLIPVVVVSVHEDREHVLRAVEQGVIGYIPKSASGPEIERAFERVLAGEVYFPRRLIEQSSSEESGNRPMIARPAADEPLLSLTNREREVVALLGRGYSVQRIATELDLSSHTVRVHLGNLMRKLGLPDRSATIHYAINLANSIKVRSTH
jgi:DNA-binding NarL/FixJ family response regulator